MSRIFIGTLIMLFIAGAGGYGYMVIRDKKIASSEEAKPTQMVFEKSNITMVIEDSSTANISVQIDPHNEWISFGELPENVILLPLFWDIDSNMGNGSFLVDIGFPFDPEVIAQLGGQVSHLSIYAYNKENSTWYPITSYVDEEFNKVHVQVKDFSRYALGFTI